MGHEDFLGVRATYAERRPTADLTVVFDFGGVASGCTLLPIHSSSVCTVNSSTAHEEALFSGLGRRHRGKQFLFSQTAGCMRVHDSNPIQQHVRTSMILRGTCIARSPSLKTVTEMSWNVAFFSIVHLQVALLPPHPRSIRVLRG